MALPRPKPPSLYIMMASGVPNAGTYTPGSSFTFSINLGFTPGGSIVNLDGLSYW